MKLGPLLYRRSLSASTSPPLSHKSQRQPRYAAMPCHEWRALGVWPPPPARVQTQAYLAKHCQNTTRYDQVFRPCSTSKLLWTMAIESRSVKVLQKVTKKRATPRMNSRTLRTLATAAATKCRLLSNWVSRWLLKARPKQQSAARLQVLL